MVFMDPARRLHELKEMFLKDFDTGLPCNCGGANIMDHVAEAPMERRYPPRMGSRHEPTFMELDSFRDKLVHEYYCDDCGAVYHENVILRRGYVPAEKQK